MMEASELHTKIARAICCEGIPCGAEIDSVKCGALEHWSEETTAVCAIIEQAIRDAITEDRRGRTFTVSELDKARAEGRAEGMERAAVIAENSVYGDDAADAIRAAKEPIMPNELDWTGTPQSAPLGQDGAVMQDEAAAALARLSAENEALVKELNHVKDALAQASGSGFGRDEP